MFNFDTHKLSITRVKYPRTELIGSSNPDVNKVALYDRVPYMVAVRLDNKTTKNFSTSHVLITPSPFYNCQIFTLGGIQPLLIKINEDWDLFFYLLNTYFNDCAKTLCLIDIERNLPYYKTLVENYGRFVHSTNHYDNTTKSQRSFVLLKTDFKHIPKNKLLYEQNIEVIK